ncbi:rod shape-determining protein [Candidatus Wolfebacteria bacterium RIFCSPLOWO2_01_FULL_45_19]|uniref:Cell shape-determining protein MreB n=1 Tax=Candidatus Wolfebacteria bacterium RIFCSPLOWO2_01_FULL_45_19 TaxID=1802557 RepID=A0A1F8DSV6_9BACT|nr:MAG: Cell shape determining protein, MreB/Mrl family [Parcubacteria group bacterium GW2011_GWB1_45_9]OGM91542.1 MAG: rod shape-determining protein [Candidatus Wolfebacteria bacterium RIFCSPLOWO2_01_FULL_45_19]
MTKFLKFASQDFGVDLGTANSLIYQVGRGIVINEPSMVALNTKTSQIHAIGHEASRMLGRTPSHIEVVKPLVNGVISDFDMAQEMLQKFFQKLGSSFFRYRRAVIGVPINLTEVERKSVEDAVLGAGAARAYIIEEPLAAALGADLPINESTASMIVDIGGGTTEIAVISTGGIVTALSLKVAGEKLNEDLIRFVREEFKLAIGEPTAEEIKKTVGSATPIDERLEMLIRGRDMATGLPREINIKNTQARVAMSRSLRLIIDAIRDVIEMTPPELVGDTLKSGVHLCGGGSLLRGMDQLIEKELGVKTVVIDDPLTCVVRGTGVAIEKLEFYKNILNVPMQPKDIS